jgi:hypothetical protein
LILWFTSFLSLGPISPISPTISSFDIVATLSSLMVEQSLSPVSLNSTFFSLMMMSTGFSLSTLEEINATQHLFFLHKEQAQASVWLTLGQ